MLLSQTFSHGLFKPFVEEGECENWFYCQTLSQQKHFRCRTLTIPPYFYLPTTPSSASAPSGWTYLIQGPSIQFAASSSANDLAPGNSIQFQYVASFSPSQLTGDAGYSYVYSGGIESDPGAFVNIQTVPAPEPSSLMLTAAGLLALAFAGHRKLRTSTVAV